MDASSLIGEAKAILARIPKKPDTAKLKGKDAQLKLLLEEYEFRNKKARKMCEEWFLKANESLGPEYAKELMKARENLSIGLRLKAAIITLTKLKTELDNKMEKRASTIADENEEAKRKLIRIISNGESNNIEFKSSLRWDHEKNEKNKALEAAIGRTICAFLNTNGGMLLIGVNDKGKILGLEKDYLTLKRQDGDGLIQYLIQLISNMLGKQSNRLISASIRNIENKEICMVSVEKSNTPAFIKYDNNEEFYIRASSTSQPLNVRESHEYIKSHWA